MEKQYPLFMRERFFWEWREMYGRREYQWFGTLTSGPDGDQISFEWMDREVKRFFTELQKAEGIQVAGYYAICRKHGRVHVHFLLLGRRNPNRAAKTLLNVDHHKYERIWRYSAEIEPVYDHALAVNYLAAQWLRNKTCLPVPYNIKLLQETAYEFEHRGPCIGGIEDEAAYVNLDEA